MRALTPIVLCAGLGLVAACVPKEHPDAEWLKPPASYDPIETEGLTLNKAGVDALTLKEGDERDAHIQGLQAEGTFKGQAKCRNGSGTGDLDHSKWGEFMLSCEAGTILFDITLQYYLYTSREVGKPLSANAYVDFGGTLVEFEYHDSSAPRSIVAKVQVGDNLTRLE